MAEEETDSADKPHEPTPKKRQDAQLKGDMPRSQDVYTAVAYAGLLAAIVGLGPMLMMGVGDIGVALIQAISTFRLGSSLIADAALGRSMALLTPVLAIPALLVLAAAAVQGHLRPVGSKLEPKLSRLSLISNAKQKFGPRGLVEFLKSSAKLTMASVLLVYVAMRHSDEIVMSMVLDPAIATQLMLRLAREFMLAILVFTVVIAAADYLWQSFDWARRNRMSHQDLKDEMKHSEGSPEMKGRRRQKAHEIVSQSLEAAVKDASVVIVNPEHYAVALAWDRSPDRAPHCVAKGVDQVALRMRELATVHGVPIHADPPTARALHSTLQVGAEIAPDQYQPVAAAIRFADALRARRRTQARWTT